MGSHLDVFAVLALLSPAVVGCQQGLVDENANGPGDGDYSLMALHKTNDLSAVCSVTVPEPEPAALASLAHITADEAKQVAQDSFTGTTATKVELDNENGCLVFGVELDNGYDAKADAGNGVFLYADTGENGGTQHED